MGPKLLAYGNLIVAVVFAAACGARSLATDTGVGGAAASGASGQGAAQGSASGDATSGEPTGTGAAGSGGDGSRACSADGQCSECLVSACSEIYCACSEDADCTSLIQCLSPCEGAKPKCAQNCLTAHVDSISKAFLVADCSATSCGEVCPTGEALGPCRKCLFTKCAPEMNACLADPDCNALTKCVGDCGDGGGSQSCVEFCLKEHSAGIPGAQALRACRTDECESECPAGK